MKFLDRLRQTERGNAVAYHLEGLLEVDHNIRTLLSNLDSGLNQEETASVLTALGEEIFTHLQYHLRQLRRPLKGMIDEAYRGLPDLTEEEIATGAEEVQRTLKTLE